VDLSEEISGSGKRSWGWQATRSRQDGRKHGVAPGAGYCLLVIFIGLSLATVGCTSTTRRVADASQELAGHLNGSSRPTQTAVSPHTPDAEQRVYIDASLSMAGYTRETNQQSVFDKLLDQLGYALPMCHVYRYGQAGKIAPKNVSELYTPTAFGHSLHNPEFYSLQFNPDDRLIEMLASENPAAFSVLVTDGVYSAPTGGTSPPVVEAMRKWMKRGLYLGILVFRSSYRGPFYSERKYGMLGSVTVSDRPVYAFVFSPTRQMFANLQEKLGHEFPKMQTIFFSDDAVHCQVGMPSGNLPLYSDAQPPNVPYHWQMFGAAIFGSQAQARLPYDIAYDLKEYYPAGGISLDVGTQYYRWIKGPFEVEPGARPQIACDIHADKPSGTTSLATPAKCAFKITPVLARDAAANYSFYAFKVNASVSSLRDEIRQLSTWDDSLPQNANQTYRFYEFVMQITNVHFQTVLAQENSPWIFVTVKNNP